MSRHGTASGLIIPPQYETRQRVYRCNLCELEFPLEQVKDFERHVVRCARAREDEIGEEIASKRDTVFTSSADPEMFEWLRNGGS